MCKKLLSLLPAVLCLSMPVRSETDSLTELMNRAEAMFQSAKQTLEAAVAVFEADSIASSAPAGIAAGVVEPAAPPVVLPPVQAVSPAVPEVAAPVAPPAAEPVPAVAAPPAADTVAAAAVPPAVVAPPPAPVKKAEAPPKPPKYYPIAKPDIEMVFVKGGKFKMGCPDENNECTSDERPRHEVKIGNYLIGKHPVTQKQWASVMGISPAHFDGDDLPVEQVSWNEVQEFIKRLNAMTGKKYRLPTEAEWEYAARGGASGRGEKFFGNRFLDDIAWYEYNSAGKTQPVGKKKPNELGLHDVLGNVWEWVGDWYGKAYYREAPVSNPKGPKHGNERVYRGGSYGSDERYCRLSLRNYNRPDYRSISLGFRLACTP